MHGITDKAAYVSKATKLRLLFLYLLLVVTGFARIHHPHTRDTLNNYMYFTLFKLQIQVNNAVYMLKIPSITRIITEINFVDL